MTIENKEKYIRAKMGYIPETHIGNTIYDIHYRGYMSYEEFDKLIKLAQDNNPSQYILLIGLLYKIIHNNFL